MAPTVPCAICGAGLVSGERFCRACGSDTESQATSVLTAPLDTSALPLNEATLPLLLRQALAGEYEVVRELGRGAMAAVFLAKDVMLGRQVAIKVLSPALVSGHGTVERFLREARTVAALSHSNIIPIYLIRRRGDLTFFVMQYIEGRSLDTLLESGPLPIPQVLRILRQVSDGLAYAHKHGVVHRDIKPANVMLDGEGNAIVTDFGIAKLPEGQALTQTGAFVGTPAYMSPEQCTAKPVTGASDQYCLGVMAYEMIVGRLPFNGATLMAVLYQHLHDPVPQIRRSDCPPALAQVVMRMLEKEPLKRWSSMEEVSTALRAVEVASPGELKLPRTVHTAPTGAPKRHRWMRAAAILVPLVGLVAAAYHFRSVGAPTAGAPVRTSLPVKPPDTTAAVLAAAAGAFDSASARNAQGDYLAAAHWYDSVRARVEGSGGSPEVAALLARADSGATANAAGCQYEARLRGGRGGILACP